NHLEDVEVRKSGLLLGMWCMYDAYNKHGDYPVARTTTLIFGENLWLSTLLLMAGRFFVSLCMVVEAILQEFFTRFVPLDDEECGVRLAAIEWLLGKCLTQKILKKKPKNRLKNAKPITKTEDCESFFNFFNTSQVPKDEDDIDEEENFRIKWSKPMTLEEYDDDDDDDEEMDDEDEEDANDDDDEEDDEDKEEGKSKRKIKMGGVPSTGTGEEERPPKRKEQ
ncbi:nucleosome assembly protein 1;4, partial [Tanacetum coccineum]